MHSPFQPIPKIRSINRQAEPQAVPAKTQSLKEWSMAGGGVPTQYKGREHVWHAMVDKFAAGGEVKMGAGGILKGIIKQGVQKVLPAAERDANLAKFLEESSVKERLYHGTKGDIKSYDLSKKGSSDVSSVGGGVYLSQNPGVASLYSKLVPGESGANVMPVYAQVKNSFEFDRAVPFKTQAEANEFSRILQDAGYDSIIKRGPNNEITELVMFDPRKIKSATGNRGTYDTSNPDISKAKGGEVHMAGAGDPAFYPRVGNIKSKNFKPIKPPPLVEDPRAMNLPQYGDVDLSVPTKENLELGSRMAQRDADLKRQREGDRSLPEKIAGGAQAGRFIGSALTQAVNSLPTRMAYGDEAADKFMQERLYKPEQPTAYEYVDELGNLLERLETEAKIPPVLPEATALQYLAGPAASQAKKAAGQGALSLAKSDAAYNLAQKALASPALAAVRPMNVVKPTGGNFLINSVEKDLKLLEREKSYTQESTNQSREQLERAKKNLAENGEDEYGLRGDSVRQSQMVWDHVQKINALNNWVESNLTNYVKKQMGTPDDPVRKLAEEGITHNPGLLNEFIGDGQGLRDLRKTAGYPEEGMGQSPMAKSWERASDRAIGSYPAGKIQVFREENPWLNKLDPNTPIYSSDIKHLGFEHIMDVLREDVTAGRIRPEQLNKVSMEQAVRRTYEYDQDMAKKMAQSQAQITEDMPVYKEYPKGYKWIELVAPKLSEFLPEGWSTPMAKGNTLQTVSADGKIILGNNVAEIVKNIYKRHPETPGNPEKTLESALKYEGDQMGHCVGGYCPDVIEGRSRIYSLRDVKGRPHVTVEVKPKKVNDPSKGLKQDSNVPEELMDEYQKAFAASKEHSMNYAKNFWPWLKQANPEEFARLTAELPPNIVQIKGKGNRAPNEEYLPYVKDFVKSGNWSYVGDLQNTGLRRTSDAFNENEIKKIQAAGIEVPTWATPDEIKAIGDKVWPGQYGTPPGGIPNGMAKGGVVHMQKGGKSGALVSIAEAVAAASKKADEILDAKKAAGKLEEVMKAKQAPMVAPQGTGLPLMPRSQGMYTPGVKQEDLPRMPKVDKARAEGKSPAYTERMQDLLDSPTVRKKVDKLINKGKELDVQEWYGTEPLRQVAMGAGRTPEQFESLMAQLSSASQRNPVDQQNKMGSYLYYLSQTGQLPEDAFLLTNKIKRGKQEMPKGTPIELPPSYGSLAQGDIFERGMQIASGDIMGALPPDKKLGTFYRNLLGNLRPVTVDVNAVRGPIIERGDPRWLASKLVEKDDEGNIIATHFPRRDVAEGRMSLKEAKKRPGFWEAAPSGSEYAGFEDLWQRGAKRHNIEPAEAQALGWYGSADVTALKTKPELYIDNLERMIKRTAEQTGQHPLQVMDDVIKGKGFLYKEGGAVEKRFDGGGMAAVDFAGPEDDGGSLDKAKLMTKILAEEAKKQGSKEAGSLSKPRALTDLLNRGVLANNPLSAGVDLFNMGLSAVGMGSDKPFLGSEYVKDLMNKYNVTSGEERPMMETALSFASPAGMIKGAMKAPGAVTKVKEALTPSKIPPLATEAKTAQAGKPTGVAYATKQEGPFYRVTPTNLDTSAAKTRGIKEADGLSSSAPLGGGAEQSGREVPKFLSSEEVGRIIADPVANEPLNIAKKYTQDTQGVDFGVPQVPSSSLAKQSGIARTFDLAVQGSPEYKSAIFGAYGREMPDLMEKIGAKNYDDLMEKAYRQMAKETDEQFRRLPFNFSYHRAGEGNYNGAKDMASDVHGNKHLYVYQGGDKHDFLHNVDPQSGLNENEKFRAVHDLLGHAIYGNEFGPKGEEMAWAVHQQMYSPLARMAMTAETRGQNSVVNYSPLNAKLKQTIAEYERLGNEALRRGDKKFAKEIAELKKQAYFGFEFAPNKAVLLPPEFMNPQFSGGMPNYLAAANRPKPGTSIQSPLTHFSNEPGLTFTDPRKYGTGIKGAEADRLMNYPGAVRDRSYFYMGEPGTVLPEPGLGVNRYRGEASSLYDITQDPLDFRVLAREANRTPYTSRANQGVTYPLQEANDMERLVSEYGYQGMANPKATKPTAIMFGQTPVQRQKRGGLSSIK